MDGKPVKTAHTLPYLYFKDGEFCIAIQKSPCIKKWEVIVGDELGGISKQLWPIEGSVHYFPQSMKNFKIVTVRLRIKPRTLWI